MLCAMTYLLRDIDPDTWTRVKAQAKADNMTAKDVMLELIKAYALGEVIISKPSAEPAPATEAAPV